MSPSSRTPPRLDGSPYGRTRRGARFVRLRYGAVAATKTPGALNETDAGTIFRKEGCSSSRPWGNAPGDTYGWHSHDYHKVLVCREGSITFHTSEGDVEVAAGDRLDIEPGTEHAATVGPNGVACVEASR